VHVRVDSLGLTIGMEAVSACNWSRRHAVTSRAKSVTRSSNCYTKRNGISFPPGTLCITFLNVW